MNNGGSSPLSSVQQLIKVYPLTSSCSCGKLGGDCATQRCELGRVGSWWAGDCCSGCQRGLYCRHGLDRGCWWLVGPGGGSRCGGLGGLGLCQRHGHGLLGSNLSCLLDSEVEVRGRAPGGWGWVGGGLPARCWQRWWEWGTGGRGSGCEGLLGRCLGRLQGDKVEVWASVGGCLCGRRGLPGGQGRRALERGTVGSCLPRWTGWRAVGRGSVSGCLQCRRERAEYSWERGSISACLR